MTDRGKKRVLLTGFNGQVGGELAKLLPSSYELILAKQGNDRLDLRNTAQLVDFVRQVKPAIIINPAAFTAVDKAESERADAESINVTAVEALAREAQSLGALLVHYSTDYVFNGDADHGPWREHDQTGPLNVYGATKLAGEQILSKLHDRHLIFRTSWVYSSFGANFMKTILRLAAEREQLKIVSDQIGTPTCAKMLAQMTLHAVKAIESGLEAFGTYHLTSAGSTSWFGFASAICDLAKANGMPLKCQSITPIPSSDFPTPAERPKNSVLNCDKFDHVFGGKRENWQAYLEATIREFIELSSFRGPL